MSERVLSALTEAGTTHANSTTEAVLASHAFAAGFWKAGKVVRVRGLAIVADQNSTDTLAIVTRFGSAALTGTAIGTTGNVDVADGDLCYVDAQLVCRSVDADGVGVIVATVATVLDAAGTALGAHGSVVGSVDTTASTYVSMTGDWSVAHADNQVAAHAFTVTELV